MCSCRCSLFLHCRSFSLNLMATSISHFLPAAIIFSCLGLCCFLFLCAKLMKASKFSPKKDPALFLFFLSKSPDGHAIYRRNAQGTWNAKFHPSLHERVDVPTYGTTLSKPKFLRCIIKTTRISYPWCSATRARKPHYYLSNSKRFPCFRLGFA